MAEGTTRGIQATLFDYFQDTEYFDLREAQELILEHEQRDVNVPSIRARIYEGIDKGLFERVGKGLYTVTRKDEQGRENTCLLINGNGRDLSFLPDNSVDSIITDHPYSLKNSLKGGNRNFANYELFQYNEKDMQEKFRVLKPGRFLVEFLPEENGDNYEYLYRIKELARKSGFQYYSKVPWKKGDRFVANTGRKSKNTEDILFFSKGRARDLRPDAKKDKQYNATHDVVEFKEHMPGGTTVHYSDMGGMGTSSETNIAPIDVNIRISVLKEDVVQAKKLLEDAWSNAVEDGFENSLLDSDYGGKYSLDELFQMPVQEYMLQYLRASGLQYDDLSNGSLRHYMSGAAGMLPTVFDVDPPKGKIHQAEKPVELLKQILAFVTLEGETALDQFAGSGVLGEAALMSGRNSILIEKDEETFAKLRQRIEALGKIVPMIPAHQEALDVAVDALEAVYDGPDAMRTFAEYQNQNGMPLAEAFSELDPFFGKGSTAEQEDVQEALLAAARAIEASDCIKQTPPAVEQCPIPQEPDKESQKILECSSLGDKRFSSIYAKITIGRKEQSIEEFYQGAKRTADGKKAGRGKPFDYLIDPFTGDKLPASDAPDLYRGLWVTYLSHNPSLVEEAAQFDDFHNQFSAKGPLMEPRHEEIIAAYVKGDRERYVEILRNSHWYRNMASKKKGTSLNDRLRDATERQTTKPHQVSLFEKQDFGRSG